MTMLTGAVACAFTACNLVCRKPANKIDAVFNCVAGAGFARAGIELFMEFLK